MEPPARILYVAVNMQLGGTERQLYELMTGLRAERFSPHLCCLRGGGPLAEALSRRGFPITVFNFPPFDSSKMLMSAGLFLSQVAALRRLMRETGPAIVHCVLPAACVAGGVAARFAGAPVLVTGRRGLGYYKEGRFLLRQAENLVNRWADAVVANSEAVRADVISRERIDLRKLRVIRNGVRIPEEPSDKGWRELAGTAIEGPTVCLVANFFPYKAHRDFIAAAALVVREIPAATFILVGDGALRGEIEGQVAALGLQRRVILLGLRPDSTLIMRLSSVVVLCSYEEGFPNVLLEAMAAGRPVVATRVGGVPEIVMDGATGLLVEPGAPEQLAAAIMRLIGNRPLAEEMGRRGRERVRTMFTVEKMVRAYEELYLELLRMKAVATS